MKYVLLLLVVVLTAGCTESSVTGMSSLRLSDAIEQVQGYMETHPGDTPNIVIEEDKDFIGFVQKTGTFKRVAFDAAGAAGIVEKNESYYVVFSNNFLAANGYDLGVYLVRSVNSPNRGDIERGLTLGSLKSINGTQVYPIPYYVNIHEFNSVVIHSREFNVPWSYATLE